MTCYTCARPLMPDADGVARFRWHGAKREALAKLAICSLCCRGLGLPLSLEGAQ